MITIHHICGHQSKVDKVTYGNNVTDNCIEISADKPCPECQEKQQKTQCKKIEDYNKKIAKLQATRDVAILNFCAQYKIEYPEFEKIYCEHESNS